MLKAPSLCCLSNVSHSRSQWKRDESITASSETRTRSKRFSRPATWSSLGNKSKPQAQRAQPNSNFRQGVPAELFNLNRRTRALFNGHPSTRSPTADQGSLTKNPRPEWKSCHHNSWHANILLESTPIGQHVITHLCPLHCATPWACLTLANVDKPKEGSSPANPQKNHGKNSTLQWNPKTHTRKMTTTNLQLNASGSTKAQTSQQSQNRVSDSLPDEMENFADRVKASEDKLFFIWHTVPASVTKRWCLVQALFPDDASWNKFRRTGRVWLRFCVREPNDSRVRPVERCRHWPEVHAANKNNTLGKIVPAKPRNVTAFLRKKMKTQHALCELELDLPLHAIHGPFDFCDTSTGLVDKQHMVAPHHWEQLRKKAKGVNADVSNLGTIDPLKQLELSACRSGPTFASKLSHSRALQLNSDEGRKTNTCHQTKSTATPKRKQPHPVPRQPKRQLHLFFRRSLCERPVVTRRWFEELDGLWSTLRGRAAQLNTGWSDHTRRGRCIQASQLVIASWSRHTLASPQPISGAITTKGRGDAKVQSVCHASADELCCQPVIVMTSLFVVILRPRDILHS